ncbi:hypothetical protein P280DRAFT_442133 [Massarina eburnea CBS 473.64]|uniref:Peptidase S54 rhomboid domain-containing protein n=1 Tax=Massarina eburnea CBS 473.64 TaxID=1395130 RepID=A0A6A6SCF6_9PLEO|nr:hypothetical protein P280DRAFT_442133 [Massarina eburnea CBS 473.64]
MSLLRCSASLLRPHTSTFRLFRPSHGRPAFCAVRHVHQPRDQRSLNRRPTPPPAQHESKPIPEQPEKASDQEVDTNKIYFSPSEGSHNLDVAEDDLPEFPKIRVRLLRPAIFALLFSTGVYALFSYRQAKDELNPEGWNVPSVPNPLAHWQPQQRPPPTPTQVVTNVWGQLDPVSKLSWSIIGTNGAIHLVSFVMPGLWDRLWHAPARNVVYTLFTSAFVHAGAMHFGFNMWACYQFLPPVGYSAIFRGSTTHMLPFYLSVAVLSGYAQHVAAVVFKQGRSIPSIFIPGGGASGALFAFFGAYCTQYPTHQVGIIFLPVGFDAQYFLPAIMLFDLVGMIRGYSFVNFGHAAHLSGAALGAAYSFFDGYNNLWRPSVNFWKRRLQNKV